MMSRVCCLLQIDSERLYLQFATGIDYNIETMNALIRMYLKLSDEMYEGCKDKRWRHYIPEDWLVLVLGRETSWLTNEVKDMFVGCHVTYKVSECMLVKSTKLNENSSSNFRLVYPTAIT
uniref:Uncharacterized protein n=1 Tax=Arundo donax TaxID=35708 RepID=A0A0A9DD17_ARUDO